MCKRKKLCTWKIIIIMYLRKMIMKFLDSGIDNNIIELIIY